MSNYRRARMPGATYFFTLVTHQRQRFLCDAPVRAALREAIGRVRASHPFAIDGWVLLPDHFHCIWTLPPGDAAFGARWGMIKRHVSTSCPFLQTDRRLSVSRKKRHESSLWQRRFWEHLIRDDDDYARHMDYLHYNPVKHGLTRSVRDWPHSTFHRLVEQGVYEESWGQAVEDGDGDAFGEP
jgi:putative transposase